MQNVRNIFPIGDIPEGSLWELKEQAIVLVDDDEYRWLPVKEWIHCFEKAC